MTVKEKARRSFNYQCKRASNCRHERYQLSCYSCPDKKDCDIQDLITKAKEKMH